VLVPARAVSLPTGGFVPVADPCPSVSLRLSSEAESSSLPSQFRTLPDKPVRLPRCNKVWGRPIGAFTHELTFAAATELVETGQKKTVKPK
jgi:hypothetical protein